jgi:hypothetical protein
MKTMKSILIAATLICATVVSTMSAQQAAAPAYQWNVALGDSVMIKRECVKYLTGETPSTWVYNVKHTVGQLGTKRFPEGVLLLNINSWVCEECIGPVNPQNQAAQAKPAETQAKPAETQAKPAETQAKPAEVTPKESEAVVVKEEPVAQPAQEATQPATEEVKQEEAPVEPAPAVEEKPETVVESAKGDSVKSKQNFKHGYDRFTIGVRGGASGLLHKVEQGNWQCGFDAMLDLQYAHYWTKDGRPLDFGIITGLSIGYAQSGMKTGVNSFQTLTDGEGAQIDYTLKAEKIQENDGQLQLEIPVMFSLYHENGLFFNVGPKFMMPVYTPYKQTISNDAYINAYFPKYGIIVRNETITGKLAESDYKTKGSDNGNQFKINIMLTAEIGYEWVLKNGNSLGLGAYADYSLFSSYKNNTSNQPLIAVTPPQGATDATVQVLSATKTYASKLSFFDVGVKVAYHFNFPKKMVFKAAKLSE